MQREQSESLAGTSMTQHQRANMRKLILLIFLLVLPCYSQTLTKSDAEALRNAPQKVEQKSPFKDPLFVGALGFNLSAQTADWITTRNSLKRGAFESNPLIGKHGERLNYVAPVVMGASAWGTYYFQKDCQKKTPDSKLCRWLPFGINVGSGIFRTWEAFHNSGVCPNGCK